MNHATSCQGDPVRPERERERVVEAREAGVLPPGRRSHQRHQAEGHQLHRQVQVHN